MRAITSRKDAGTRVADMFPSLRGQLRRARLHRARRDRSRRRATSCSSRRRTASRWRRRASSSTPACGSSISPPISGSATPRCSSSWYKMPHACPDLLAESVYGLPGVNREAIRKARIVGNPGCYPTAVQLGFLPLARGGRRRHRAPDRRLQVRRVGRRAQGGARTCCFAEASDNFTAYGVTGHRHHPGDRAGARTARSKTPVKLVFTPHLLPMIRGILATLYAPLTRHRRRPAGAVTRSATPASRSST